MLRFAANLTWMYGEHAFPDRFATAAKDGFTAVEFLFPYEHPAQELEAWLRAHSLSQVLFNAPPGNWLAGDRGLASLPGREKEFRAGIHTALDYARTLDCPNVHVMAGVHAKGMDPVAIRSTFVANLAWAAHVAEDAGKVFLIEPLNTRDMPEYFLNRQDEAHAIVQEIGSPALKVQMDLYHCQIAEGDVSIKLRKYLRRGELGNVGHIQIAGVPDRNEPDTGELDYDYVLDLIDELGYEGWIGCEYRPKGNTSEGLSWLRNRL